MGNYALGLNEVPKEWLWMEEGRGQSATLRSRAGQRSVKENGKEWPQEDRKKPRREGYPRSQMAIISVRKE